MTIRLELSTAEAEALLTFGIYGATEYEDDPGAMPSRRFKAGTRALHKLGSAINAAGRVSGADARDYEEQLKTSKYSGVTPAHVTEIEQELKPPSGPRKTVSVAQWDLPPGVGLDSEMGL